MAQAKRPGLKQAPRSAAGQVTTIVRKEEPTDITNKAAQGLDEVFPKPGDAAVAHSLAKASFDRHTKSTSSEADASKNAKVATDQTVIRAPRTVEQARDLAYSDGAKALIDLAAAIAVETKPDRSRLGARDLFWALLVDGIQRGQRVESASSWLHRWITDKSSEKLTSALGRIHDIKRVPVNGLMPTTAHAGAVIARAVAIAQATVGRNKFDLRHLAAALTLPDRLAANENVIGIARHELAVDLAEFPAQLVKIIANSRERNEDLRAWRALLANPIPSTARNSASQSAAIQSLALPGFAADRPASTDSDPLGIAADVSAFARLICLEEARPPLSIGLFGEWGSGKSSFMERLQREIAKLTRKERESRSKPAASVADSQTPPPAPGPRFVENVVQIRFNAWHFADANLWASLTAEFFDQLRRGGHYGLRSSNYLALVGKVADHVRSLEATAQKADGAVAAAAAASTKAEEALAAAREKLAASDLTLASAHLGKALEDFQKKNAASLKDVGTRVYRTDLSTDIDGLKAAVSEASTIPGKIMLVSRVLAGGGAATWLGASAVVLFAVIGVLWRYGDPTSLAVLVQRAIGWGGGTLAALGALWQALAKVRPVLDGAWEYAKAVEAARKQLAAEVKTKEGEAASAAGILAAAKAEADKAKAPLAQYGQGAAVSAPGTILRYFLFEDGDVRDYDKHVGLVSRARRSFEQLDAIVAAGREGPAARRKKAQGEPLTPKEATALERFEAMQLDEAGLTAPDRIVLYIDDLDRCTHQQVYDVLQAIHLLLAFELFVVVVGVDVGWIEQAVARQLDRTDAGRETGTPQEREARDRRRAIDYLEKIFQLPFWLRPLSTEGADASYGVYVRGLLQANLEATGDNPLKPDRRTIRTKSAPGGIEALTDASVAPDAETLDAIDPEEMGSLGQALETVRLTQPEVDFLASPEIGAIAAKSPRAVNRMINVYRIIRARLDDAELADFLGTTGKPPNWPIAVFLAAVECGQPVEVADAVYDALKRMDGHEAFDTASFKAIVDEGKLGASRTAESALMAADRMSNSVLGVGIHALNGRRGSPERGRDWATAGMVFTMARIVRRYSFNRYH